jgi:hypothetical protein
MVGSSYSVAERRAGVEPARPNFTSAIDAEDPTTNYPRPLGQLRRS